MAIIKHDRFYLVYSVLTRQAVISFRTSPRGGDPSKARIVWEAMRHCLRLLGHNRAQVYQHFEDLKIWSHFWYQRLAEISGTFYVIFFISLENIITRSIGPKY